jgi:hypothetical protein
MISFAGAGGNRKYTALSTQPATKYHFHHADVASAESAVGCDREPVLIAHRHRQLVAART